MRTTHKLIATIPQGDPDQGAEVDVEITFSYSPGYAPVLWGDAPEPGAPAEIEFVSVIYLVGGRQVKFYGAFADLEQNSLNSLAEDWLESDDGISAAMDAVEADMEAGREFRDEMRAEMRREEKDYD